MSKPQLFMLHFAGGNSDSFNFMNPYLGEFKLETLELPGRGASSDEILIKDFSTAANYIYTQIKKRLTSRNFLIYGHSMGASLAFKVTGMLEEDSITPLCLIVSGNAGPKIKENKKRYLLEDKEFIAEVTKLGGLPLEFLESQELLDYFIPILKADFEISEENNLGSESIIKTPIYSIMGDVEKHVEDIMNWSKYTTSSFDYEILTGNHFFIFNNTEKVCSVIKECYKKNVAKKALDLLTEKMQ